MERKDYLHKDYLIEQWKLAMADYRLADTDSKRADALRSLHKLHVTATVLYGFEFVESSFVPLMSGRETGDTAAGRDHNIKEEER